MALVLFSPKAAAVISDSKRAPSAAYIGFEDFPIPVPA